MNLKPGILNFESEILNRDQCKLDELSEANPELLDAAYDEFCQNLETFRKLVPIKTICMHGSLRSPYDNRDIWKKYSYKDLGITGDPYFDIDFSKVAYYTDTGRMWDGDKYSVRDKVGHRPLTIDHGKNHSNTGNHLSSMVHGPWPSFHTTAQIIHAIQTESFPSRAMLTFHPQRWTDKPLPWVKELVMQNLKNVVKRFVVGRKN